MQFSNTSLKNGVIQLAESLCKLGDGGITNDSTLFAQFTGHVNQAYKKVAAALLRVDKNWRWDDFNNTDFPIATITMITQQRDYALPAATVSGNASTLYRVNRVRAFDVAGNPYILTPLTPSQEETDDTAAASGKPMYYRMIGNSIRLSPKPLTGSVTLTNGLEIQFQRSTSDFTVSDTSKQAGFMDIYHDLLAYDAASTYLLPYNQQLASQYALIFAQRLELLQEDYSNKNDDVKNRIVMRTRSSR